MIFLMVQLKHSSLVNFCAKVQQRWDKFTSTCKTNQTNDVVQFFYDTLFWIWMVICKWNKKNVYITLLMSLFWNV